MKFKDKWMACVSLGEQTFRTEISDQLSSVKTLLLLYFLLISGSVMNVKDEVSCYRIWEYLIIT